MSDKLLYVITGSHQQRGIVELTNVDGWVWNFTIFQFSWENIDNTGQEDSVCSDAKLHFDELYETMEWM